ncbi:hypothetical protein LK464_03570 [Mycobacteroides abscessus subsp. abscessus]|uniref:hypothetical protein n=1 Tax=Mycobacteroides abscessus TaxID=36809 RepID=UPI00189643C4|nr:hypothetical protein [Mycobacteroides abscessus]UEA25146.1 hypothetical protein LK464_03570 [Mycobacteroides abscessus subsp. abscessus]
MDGHEAPETALTSTFSDCATVLERATMVAMHKRLHRSPRTLSVTSPARVGLLTCGFTLATLTVATFNTSVAHANTPNTDICDPSSDYYIGGALCGTPTPAPASGGSGGGGISAWFSSFFEDWGAVLFVGGIAAFIGWVVIVNRRESAEEKQKGAAATQARGRAIAEQHHAEQRALAEQSALATAPDPSVYDPHGVGLAPPPTPAPKVPPAPPTSPTDLARYSAFNAVVPWMEGSALAAVTAPNGDRSRAEAAFAEAVRTADVGTTDENGNFIPNATLASVNAYLDGSGDVEFVVRTRDITIGEKQLARVTPLLLLTARVASAGNWEREVETGRYMLRLSMNAKAAQQQEQKPAEPEQPRVDPRWA